jgi:DNA-binding NarL/FixJ family response regulator
MPVMDGIEATRRLTAERHGGEAEMLTLIARGPTNAEIAGALFLGHDTVKTHINRVFTKTGSRDRVAAAQYTQRHGPG